MTIARRRISAEHALARLFPSWPRELDFGPRIFCWRSETAIASRLSLPQGRGKKNSKDQASVSLITYCACCDVGCIFLQNLYDDADMTAGRDLAASNWHWDGYLLRSALGKASPLTSPEAFRCLSESTGDLGCCWNCGFTGPNSFRARTDLKVSWDGVWRVVACPYPADPATSLYFGAARWHWTKQLRSFFV